MLNASTIPQPSNRMFAAADPCRATGVGLGIAAAAIFDAFGAKLSASSPTGGSGSNFLGLGSATLRTAQRTIELHARLTIELVLLGIGLAVIGGLLAGAAGGLRAGRLRPAEALRRVE